MKHKEDYFIWTHTVQKAEEVSKRIDVLVREKLSELQEPNRLENISRSNIQTWIRNHLILVNGEAIKPNYKVVYEDLISVKIPPPEELELIPEDIKLDIVYEDQDILVINKPRGMVVHPAPGHMSGTLVHALMNYSTELSSLGGEFRQGIVHRIDRDTSGLMIVAKHDAAHQNISLQLKERSVTRKYIALVHGVLSHKEGTVDAPIGRHPYDRKKFTVTEENSKEAITHFVLVEQYKDEAMLELKLETGRTHQIRVHMKFIGHPIIGDPVYGRSKGVNMPGGQALHASEIGLIHPTSGEWVQFEASLPHDMRDLITRLRNR